MRNSVPQISQPPLLILQKQCGKCPEKGLQDISNFCTDRYSRDGLHTICRACQRKSRQANKQRISEYGRGYREQNRERIRANRRRWRDANPDDNLQRFYGLSNKKYQIMLEAQEGMCAICKQPEIEVDYHTGRVKPLSIDHSHETGKVRGLLCGRCNRGLGYFRDNPTLLLEAARYLEKAI